MNTLRTASSTVIQVKTISRIPFFFNWTRYKLATFRRQRWTLYHQTEWILNATMYGPVKKEEADIELQIKWRGYLVRAPLVRWWNAMTEWNERSVPSRLSVLSPNTETRAKLKFVFWIHLRNTIRWTSSKKFSATKTEIIVIITYSVVVNVSICWNGSIIVITYVWSLNYWANLSSTS